MITMKLVNYFGRRQKEQKKLKVNFELRTNLFQIKKHVSKELNMKLWQSADNNNCMWQNQIIFRIFTEN